MFASQLFVLRRICLIFSFNIPLNGCLSVSSVHISIMNQNYILRFELALLLIYNPFKTCHGAVPESEFLPFRESDGNSRFRFGDDNSKQVLFNTPFKLFNKTYWNTYISGNGILSFGTANSAQSSSCQATNFTTIIPFWADANEGVDREGSQLTHMEITSNALLTRITDVIRSSFSQHRRINLTWLYVVTWRNVAAHDSSYSSSRNTFQVILCTNGVHSFALFYYNKINWSKGNAVAGFNIGDSHGTRRLYKIPGSCSRIIENIEDTSNIGQPGKWIFQVNKDIVDPSTSTSSPTNCEDGKSNVRIDNPVVSIMGNVPLIVHGLCLEENATVMCNFQDRGQPRPQEMHAVLLPAVVVCPVPFLYSLGKMVLHILVSYPDINPTIYKAHLYVVKEPDFSDLPIISITKIGEMSMLSANWDPTLLSMKDITDVVVSDDTSNIQDTPVNHCSILSGTVQIVILEYNGKKWKNLGPIIPPILNNGIHMSPANISLLNQLIPRDGKLLVRTFAIEAKHAINSGESLSKIFPSNTILGTANLTEFVHANMNFSNICQSWYDNEPNTYFDSLSCPLTVDQARLDWRFALEKVETTQILNEGASVVYVQKVPSHNGASSLCAYNADDRLLTWIPDSARVFRRSPNNWHYYWKYLVDDFLPYMYCCKWGNREESNDCSKYIEKRPIDYGTDYIPPRPVRVVGDPHITTFDGISYTFNGAGEFWLLKYTDKTHVNSVLSEFKMQVRMEPFQANASVVTAVVIEEVGNDYEVKVQVVLSNFKNKKGLSILLDGEPLNVYENDKADENSPNSQREFTLYHSGVVITLKSYSEALVSFSSGISFNFKAIVDGTSTEKALNIVGSAGANLKNKFEGLLGDYDGDASNDLKLPNGTILSRDNETMEEIHKDFGLKWIVHKSDTMFKYLPNQSYAQFHQPTFSPWFLPSEVINGSTILEDNFCEDSQDCMFDYLATGSSEIAKATMGTTILFKEIYDMSNEIVQQCERVNPPTKGYFEGSSYVMGSTIVLKCNENYTLNHNESQYTCGYSNQTRNGTTPTWLTPTGRRFPLTVKCMSTQEMKTEVTTKKPDSEVVVPPQKIEIEASTIKNEPEKEITTTTTKAKIQTGRTRKTETTTDVTTEIAPRDEITNYTEVTAEVTEKGIQDSTARLSSADSSSSVWTTLVFLAGLIIISIIAVVLIMEYPACKPVKCFVTNKYHRFRMNNDDHLESESIGMT